MMKRLLILALTVSLALIGQGNRAQAPPSNSHIYLSFRDNGRIVRLDGFAADRWSSYGRQGLRDEEANDIFYTVSDIGVDGRERLYIADQGCQRIVRVDAMDGRNWVEYRLHLTPGPIFVTEAGRIYILLLPIEAKEHYRLIRMEDMTGRGRVDLDFSTQGSGKMQFEWPQSLYVDAQERIYIADAANDRIVRIDDMQGNGWTTLGTSGSGPSQFRMPMGLCVNRQGQIYVADRDTGRIVRFDDMTGKGWTEFKGAAQRRLSSPKALWIDREQHIYFSEELVNSQIVRMDDMSGRNLTVLKLPATASHSGIPSKIVMTDAAGTRVLPPGRKDDTPVARTPRTTAELSEAIRNNDINAVKRWLFARGDPNISLHPDHYTALMWAAYEHCTQIMRLLLEHGANPRLKSDSGTTALHTAALRGYKEDILLLLNTGADVNAQASDGETPLHSACKKEHSEAVELLLQHHANPNLRARDKQTPLDVALYHDDKSSVTLLRKYGGKTGKELDAASRKSKKTRKYKS